jgi:hypothetical protein
MDEAKYVRQNELNVAARERCRYAIVLQTATSKERRQSLIHDYKKTLQYVRLSLSRTKRITTH